jgi:hypothetical protein
MKPTPPLPKRPRDMTLDRYNALIESFWLCAINVMAPEQAEEFMNEAGFFGLWEPRFAHFVGDESVGAHVQRALRVGVAEGDAALTALAESLEGKAFLARVFPPLVSH